MIDLGHVLRVPRKALEELIGADLSTVTLDGRVDESPAVVPPADPPTQETRRPVEAEPVKPASKRQRRGRQDRITNQLDLFDSKSKSG